MKPIVTAYARIYDFDYICTFMDADIKAAMDKMGDGEYESNQEFYEDYCARHHEKFGEEFVFNTADPIPAI